MPTPQLDKEVEKQFDEESEKWEHLVDELDNSEGTYINLVEVKQFIAKIEQRAIERERLTGAIIVLYELWDNSHYSMGKAGSDRIKEKFIEYLGKDWSAKIGEFVRDEKGFAKAITPPTTNEKEK